MRAGASLEQAAEAMGLSRASSAQHYEDDYKKSYIPMDKVRGLAPLLVGHGMPPISEEEVYALAGADNFPQIQALVNKGLRTESVHLMIVDEVDARASAGGGAELDMPKKIQEWGFPEEWIRHELQAAPSELTIITIDGDSMVPTINPGDKAVVNRAQTMPSPPGIFVLWDGLGIVAKRLEHIPNTSPPKVRVTSDNTRYEPYERTAEEISIVGRVVARWQRF